MSRFTDLFQEAPANLEPVTQAPEKVETITTPELEKISVEDVVAKPVSATKVQKKKFTLD